MTIHLTGFWAWVLILGIGWAVIDSAIDVFFSGWRLCQLLRRDDEQEPTS